MKFLKFTVALLLLIAVGGCSRDPEVLKRKYVENGNKYFNNGKYKEASILYRKALAKDQRFGEAYERLAEAELRLGRVGEAVKAYRRAVELLPKNSDVVAKLANLYMAAYVSNTRDQSLGNEIQSLLKTLEKRDPNSFNYLRLSGYMEMTKQNFEAAAKNLRAAEQAKPGQPEVAVALGQTLLAATKYDEAESVIKTGIEKNKTYAALYDLLVAYYLRANKVPEAEAVLKSKIANNPKEIGYRLQLAALYTRTQRPADRDAVIQQILDHSKDFPGAYLKTGDFFLATGEFPRGQEIYERGLATNPENKLDYQKRIVEALAAGGKPKEAMTMVEKLLGEHKDNSDLRSMRAALILQSGDRTQLQRAVEDFASALQRNPKNFVLQFNLGRAYLVKNELDAARVQFQEALKLRPDYIPARLLLAQVYLSKRDWAKAMQESGTVLQQDSRNLQGRLMRSAALLGAGDYGQARKALEETLQLYPTSRDAQFQMAMLNLGEKKPAESEKFFRNMQQSDARDPRGLLGLVETYMMSGRKDQALRLLADELKTSPGRDDLRLAMGNIAFRAQDYDTAIGSYKTLIDKRPQAADLWVRLGVVYGRAGKYGEAYQAFDKAISIDPKNPVTFVERAMLLEHEGKSEEARPIYDQVLKLQPDNPIALNNLAYMMAEEGKDLDLALMYAQRAKQRLPQNADVADTLGWVYIKKNLSDSAIQIFKELTKKNPENPMFRYHLALALVQKGDKMQAKRELESALHSNPTKPVEAKIRELMSRIG